MSSTKSARKIGRLSGSALAALLLAGCTGNPVTDPGATAPTPARMLELGSSANKYCLVRQPRAGSDVTKPTKLPVVGLARADHWQTNGPIELQPLSYPHGSCNEAPLIEVGDKLSIERVVADEYDVTLTREPATTLLTTRFKKARGNDAYLVAKAADCEGDCGPLGVHDAYLYVANEKRGSKNAKYVFIDFFPTRDETAECRRERPETAMKTHQPNCELPWKPGFFPAPRIELDFKQLGTGGGYEPPP